MFYLVLLTLRHSNPFLPNLMILHLYFLLSCLPIKFDLSVGISLCDHYDAWLGVVKASTSVLGLDRLLKTRIIFIILFVFLLFGLLTWDQINL